jgi:hypothetical protein
VFDQNVSDLIIVRMNRASQTLNDDVIGSSSIVKNLGEFLAEYHMNLSQQDFDLLFSMGAIFARKAQAETLADLQAAILIKAAGRRRN